MSEAIGTMTMEITATLIPQREERNCNVAIGVKVSNNWELSPIMYRLHPIVQEAIAILLSTLGELYPTETLDFGDEEIEERAAIYDDKEKVQITYSSQKTDYPISRAMLRTAIAFANHIIYFMLAAYTEGLQFGSMSRGISGGKIDDIIS